MRACIHAVIATACLVSGAAMLAAGGAPGTAIAIGLTAVGGGALAASLWLDWYLQRRRTAY